MIWVLGGLGKGQRNGGWGLGVSMDRERERLLWTLQIDIKVSGLMKRVELNFIKCSCFTLDSYFNDSNQIERLVLIPNVGMNLNNTPNKAWNTSN